MDDLISRKALLEELQKAYDIAHRIFQNQNSPESQECCKLQLRTLRSVIEDVKEAPTINAVEVVRCKDCKFRYSNDCTMAHSEYFYDEDDRGDYRVNEWTADDGFCHCAAKMDGGKKE